jgi:hypothetical protein
LVEIGAAAAVASLAIGVFTGASGIVPSSVMLGTTTVASADTSDTSVDLVTLAYDNSSDIAGDLQ